MKAINFHFTLFVWTLLFIFGFSGINAQEIQRENSVCIELKDVGLSLADDEVLVAGEVSAPAIIKVKKPSYTLTMYLALVGGIKRNAPTKSIQVFKCRSNSETAESITVTNLEKIKKGIEPDLEIKGGEIILVLDNNSRKSPLVLEAFEPRHCGLSYKK